MIFKIYNIIDNLLKLYFKLLYYFRYIEFKENKIFIKIIIMKNVAKFIVNVVVLLLLFLGVFLISMAIDTSSFAVASPVSEEVRLVCLFQNFVWNVPAVLFPTIVISVLVAFLAVIWGLLSYRIITCNDRPKAFSVVYCLFGFLHIALIGHLFYWASYWPGILLFVFAEMICSLFLFRITFYQKEE